MTESHLPASGVNYSISQARLVNEDALAELGGFYADRSRQTDPARLGSVEATIQSFAEQLKASNETVRATLQVVRLIQQDLQLMQQRHQDLEEEVKNTRAVQRNFHSYKLNHRVQKISAKRRDGLWASHPLFPKTIRDILRLNGGIFP